MRKWNSPLELRNAFTFTALASIQKSWSLLYSIMPCLSGQLIWQDTDSHESQPETSVMSFSLLSPNIYEILWIKSTFPTPDDHLKFATPDGCSQWLLSTASQLKQLYNPRAFPFQLWRWNECSVAKLWLFCLLPENFNASGVKLYLIKNSLHSKVLHIA